MSDFLKADKEARTPDLLITNELLYQLSYIGKIRVFGSHPLCIEFSKVRKNREEGIVLQRLAINGTSHFAFSGLSPPAKFASPSARLALEPDKAFALWFSSLMYRIFQSSKKQRGRDSNPRWNCSHTTFPRLHLKPLGHLSALCKY